MYAWKLNGTFEANEHRFGMVVTTCTQCGVAFGLLTPVFKNWEECGRELYCPNGHALHFAPCYQEEAEQLQGEVDELESELKATQLEVTKLKCEREHLEAKAEAATTAKKPTRKRTTRKKTAAKSVGTCQSTEGGAE